MVARGLWLGQRPVGPPRVSEAAHVLGYLLRGREVRNVLYNLPVRPYSEGFINIHSLYYQVMLKSFLLIAVDENNKQGIGPRKDLQDSKFV